MSQVLGSPGWWLLSRHPKGPAPTVTQSARLGPAAHEGLARNQPCMSTSAPVLQRDSGGSDLAVFPSLFLAGVSSPPGGLRGDCPAGWEP